MFKLPYGCKNSTSIAIIQNYVATYVQTVYKYNIANMGCIAIM